MNNQQRVNIDLSGKIALVTGGTKGIGKAIADHLTQAGATVIVTARNQPEEPNPNHYFIASDLTQPSQVTQLAGEILEKFGKVDVLIDNIGGLTTPGGGFTALTDEHWTNELDFNLLAATRLDRAIVPKMIEEKSGVVIHISTGASKLPLWDLNMAYAVSKAALNCYSKALANEVASHGVRVLTVSPGAVKTPPMEQFLQDFAANAGIPPEEAFATVISKMGGVPMGRMAEPEEIASLVVFLASPAASYLTGTNYGIDGGAYPVV